MKNLLIATILTFATAVGFAGEKIEKKDDAKAVSYSAKKQLEAEFADAKSVTWSVNEDYQKATFTSEGKKLTAIFDVQGNYLAATQAIAFEDLPADAKKSIEKVYKDYTFSDAIKIVARPASDYQSNDVGTYWIDLTKDNKQIYLNYTEASGLSFYKRVEGSANAKN